MHGLTLSKQLKLDHDNIVIILATSSIIEGFPVLRVSHFILGTAMIASLGAWSVERASRGAPDDASKPPNILLLSIDDLRPDLGSYGHPVAVTPNLDAFAATGLLFERAYTQQAVCTPSRAALLTGLRPATTGIKRLDQTVSDTVPNIITLNKLFKQNGYETVSVGKIYHHAKDDRDGWSQPPYDQAYKARQDRRKKGLPRIAHDVWTSDALLPDEKNIAHAMTELERFSQQDAPFFLAVGLHRPHLPFRAREKDWDHYSTISIPGPVSDKRPVGAPRWAVVAWEIWNYDDTPPKHGPMPFDKAEVLRHGYLASVSYADDLVGQLLDKVSSLGLDDETIVVVWSDHGFKLGDHGGWAKHSTVELDIHIPMMIRVPGMNTVGQRSSALVETVDVYPTLLEAAGLTQPHALEGLSMLPLVARPQRPWKEAAFAQYPRHVNKQLLMGKTVRTDRYRYTAWVVDKTGEILAQELYDHQIDPHETRSVSENPDYIDVLERHEALRQAGWRAVRQNL